MKEIIDPFDALADALRYDGLQSEADTLRALLHERAWTTGSEFYGEIGLEMKRIRNSCISRFGPETNRLFTLSVKAVKKVWPEIGL